MKESAIQRAAFLAVGTRPDVAAFRLQSGLFRTLYSDQKVRVGQPGMADGLMVVAVTVTPEMVGRVLGVAAFPEFKTQTGRQAEAQHNFQRAVQSRGAPYRLIRSAEDMLAFVADVQRGELFRK